jgi:hypothetical protein
MRGGFMVNVALLQGAAVPETDAVFYLQMFGLEFTGAKDAEIHVSGDVAVYVKTVIQSGLLCVVKGRYVPAGNYIDAESVSFLRDQLKEGDPLWG